MKKIFIDHIRENEDVVDIFLVKEKTLAISRNGSPYLNLQLMDRTGEIAGRVWEKAEKLSRIFSKNDFINIRAKATIFKENLQLNILDIKRCDDSDISAEDFLPRSAKDVDEMYAELKTLSLKVKDQYLNRLINLFLDNNKFSQLFKQVPAAKGLHHAYLGGLLEHTLSVCKLILTIAPHYEGINIDLLFTGGLLHDIGKIYELTYKKSFDYTDEGRLLGHISLGFKIIEAKIKQISGFPPKLAMLLEHLILSHHGQYHFGSPKRPKTLEAMMLYYLDDLDAKMNGIKNFIEKERGNNSSWTGYNSIYERFIYKETYSEEKSTDPQRPLPFPTLIEND